MLNAETRLDELIRSLRVGRLNRRQVILRGLAAGLSIQAIATALTVVAGETGLTNLAATANAQAADPAILEEVKATGMLRAPEPEPKRGGTARLGIRAATASYDMHQGATPHILVHMYNRLVRPNPLDGMKTIIPDLATSWEISKDGLAYVFHLREGVKYHDGAPFSADDVVATFSRIIAPPEGIIVPIASDFRGVESVEAVDPQTVKFTLSEPRPDLLDILAGVTSVIYSKASLDANNQDLRTVIAPGTGPFMYEEHTQDTRWLFKPNPDYWNKELPYVDNLEIINAESWSDRGTAVLTGRADWSWNVSRETFDEGQKRPDSIATKEVPGNGMYTVVINTQKEPFNDPRVRRAMHLVINRPILIQAFRSQETIHRTRWVPHTSSLAMSAEDIATLPPYQEDKTDAIAEAKQLLADAGYPDGFDGVELLSGSVAPQAEILAPAIQDQLKRSLNIETTIRVNERALLIEDEQAGRFDLVLDTFGSSTPDFSPVGHLYFATGASQNYGKYSNPEFDKLLQQSDAEQDPAARADLLRQIEDLLDADPPWLIIGYTFHLFMWQSRLKGLAFDQRQLATWGQADTAWIDE